MLMKRYGTGTRILLILAPVLTALICLGIGRYSFNLADICKLLYTYAVSGKDAIEPQAYSVVFNIRLPRIILAVLCGAGLAVSGAAFQPYFPMRWRLRILWGWHREHVLVRHWPFIF